MTIYVVMERTSKMIPIKHIHDNYDSFRCRSGCPEFDYIHEPMLTCLGGFHDSLQAGKFAANNPYCMIFPCEVFPKGTKVVP